MYNFITIIYNFIFKVQLHAWKEHTLFFAKLLQCIPNIPNSVLFFVSVGSTQAYIDNQCRLIANYNEFVLITLEAGGMIGYHKVLTI